METKNSEKIELFQVLRKNSNGTITGVLSDTSLDRDDEFVGEEAFDKLLKKESVKVRLMMDHENKIMKRIGDWTNLHKSKVGSHVALVGTPKFFLSNPNAKIIKGMLDEGAELDISIGAMVKDFEMIKMSDGRDVKKFTELELLEGSFVGIGSNRNSSGRKNARLKIAKMFDEQLEEKKMEDANVNKKDFDAEVLKVAELEKKFKELSDKNKELDETIASIKKEAEEAVAEKEEAEDKVEGAKGEKEAAEEEVKSLKAKLEKLKSKTVKKAINDSPSGNELSSADMISKEVEAGALPVMKK